MRTYGFRAKSGQGLLSAHGPDGSWLRCAARRIAFVEFFTHVFEEFRFRLGRIFADFSGLRHSGGGSAVRRPIAFVVDPGNQLAALRVFSVALAMAMHERRVIPRPIELGIGWPG